MTKFCVAEIKHSFNVRGGKSKGDVRGNLFHTETGELPGTLLEIVFETDTIMALKRLLRCILRKWRDVEYVQADKRSRGILPA